MFSTEQEAQAHIDQQLAEARTRQAKTLDMTAQLQSLRVTGRSRNGDVEVVVGQSGGLLDVTISPQSPQLTPETVRAALLEANSAAQQALVAQVRTIAEDAFGRDSGTTAAFVANYERSFPEPPTEVRPPSTFGGGA